MPASQFPQSHSWCGHCASLLLMVAMWCATVGAFLSTGEGALQLWMEVCVCTLTVAVGLHITCPVVQMFCPRRLRALAGCADVMCALALLVLALSGVSVLFTAEEVPSSSHLAALCLVVLYLLYDLWRLVECVCVLCVLLSISSVKWGRVPHTKSIQSDADDTGRLSEVQIKQFTGRDSIGEPSAAFRIEDISSPGIVPEQEELRLVL